MLKKDRSQRELDVMMNAIKRDAHQFFGMGKFSAKKLLDNGAVVRVSITMPNLASKKKTPAQIRAWDDIQSGKVEHNKYTCPGCPIH
jgi:hypothetical protein